MTDKTETIKKEFSNLVNDYNRLEEEHTELLTNYAKLKLLNRSINFSQLQFDKYIEEKLAYELSSNNLKLL